MQLARDLRRQPRARPAAPRGRPRRPPRASRSARAARACAPGPTPGSSSSSELVIARSRRERWWVIAKRCASSRTRCSSCSSGVEWSSTSGARAARAGRPPRCAWPARRRPRRARESPAAAPSPAASWPLPPSITTTFGSDAKLGVVGGVVRRDVGLALPLREAASEHLGHRGEVVGRALDACGS